MRAGGDEVSTPEETPDRFADRLPVARRCILGVAVVSALCVYSLVSPWQVAALLHGALILLHVAILWSQFWNVCEGTTLFVFVAPLFWGVYLFFRP